MPDPSIVNPGDSTYSIPDPTTTVVGSVPGMDMQRVLPRQTSTGLARGVQQLGSPNVYVDSGNEQIVVAKTDNSLTTNQVLMGNQVNKGEGFYVTKPGIDVTTAKNDSDFIFNSNQNVFKIIDKNTSYSIPSFSIGLGQPNYSFITIPHGQTFEPIVDVYVKGYIVNPAISLIASSFVPLPIFGNTDNGLAGNYYFPNTATSPSYYFLSIVYSVDETNISIIATTAFNGTADTLKDIPITYYIRQETAN